MFVIVKTIIADLFPFLSSTRDVNCLQKTVNETISDSSVMPSRAKSSNCAFMFNITNLYSCSGMLPFTVLSYQLDRDRRR